MQKRAIYYFASLFVLATVTVACQPEASEDKQEPFYPMVELESAVQKTFVHKVSLQGNVNTDEEVLLNSEIGGTVERIFVKEGQRVTKGQKLISLDGETIVSNIAEVQSQLEYAEYMLSKQKALRDNGLGSEVDFKSAENQVISLRKKLNSLSTQQGKTIVRAPFTGVVDQIFAKNGQVVGPQSPVLRLVNNDHVYITADISEKYINSVKEGTDLTVTFPNYSDTTMQMKVSSVGNYINPTNRTVSIRADVKENDFLLPNMLAELQVTDQTVPEALMIPSVSIIKDQENNDFVYTAHKADSVGYTLKKVQVRVLNKYDGWAHVSVLKGTLKPRMKVVTAGAKGVTELDIVTAQ